MVRWGGATFAWQDRSPVQTNVLPGTTNEKGEPRKAVLVTTAHKGVFFGYLASEVSKAQITITRGRNVIYFDAATKGFMGLVENGPTNGCRIGPAVTGQSILFDITGVFEVSEAAVSKFEDAPWSR
jgi:hypothetical protein